jgi:hypothetical protein
VQVHKVGSRVVIYSRNGHDFTERFPSIAQLRMMLAPSASLPARPASQLARALDYVGRVNTIASVKLGP